MNISCSQHILLTGAGFTHNFGAPLANHLWAIIFNHRKVQNSEKVRSVLLGNSDFETVYHIITEGQYSEEEKQAIESAVFDGYLDIDATIRDFSFHVGAPYQVNIYQVQKMIDAFTGTKQEPGFIFTLNQDLFLERKYFNGERPILPGINSNPKWFSSIFNETILDQDQIHGLPTAEEIESKSEVFLSNAKLYYLKLHGSCNWTSSIRQRQMVIGRAKVAQIKEEPLLSWYFDIFKEAVLQPNRKLLSIGYGFGDEHINCILAEGVAKCGLRIYVISPSSPSNLQASLKEKKGGEKIWEGLGGYYPYNFEEMFPADQSESIGWLKLQEQFFERRIR